MATGESERRSASDVARRRSASRDLAPGLALLVASEVSLVAFDADVATGLVRLAWVLSPLLGIGLLVRAQVRILGRSDERERADALAAMATGFAVVMTALAVVGVLQAAGIGDARQGLQVTTGLGIASWVVASLLKERRVR